MKEKREGKRERSTLNIVYNDNKKITTTIYKCLKGSEVQDEVIYPFVNLL